MKEKKSNRAVPYLYYEVEKKRNSKLLPRTKMSPNIVMKLAQECFWVFSLDFETALFFMDVFDPGFDQIFVRFSTKNMKKCNSN